MKICKMCVLDVEIKALIDNAGIIGNCDICHEANCSIYDSEVDDTLSYLFDKLISLYTPHKSLTCKFPNAEAKMLKTLITNDWRIFNTDDEQIVLKILKSICSNKYSENPELFDKLVGFEEIYNEKILEKRSILSNYSWEEFVKSLKHVNRFHSHYLNLNLFEKFLSYMRKTYVKGHIFYRSRICDREGLKKHEMSAPPVKLATDGRANSKGIRCLYLSNNLETTIHEIRASQHDFLSIGKFVLKEDIVVVDLKKINTISPFIDGLDILDYAINVGVLNTIDSELAKTLRRSDSALDYLPTQYIADFIKSIQYNGNNEYSGIEYKSTMHDEGYNIAIFDPDLFECVETKVYQIDSINYEKSNLY